MITQRLEKLRGLMSEHHIHYYIIPTNDYHLSEYVGDYFCARKYNEHMTKGSLLIEIGTDMNTLAEAEYSGTLLGKTLVDVLDDLAEG